EITDNIFNGFIQVSIPADNPAAARGDGRLWVGFQDPQKKEFTEAAYRRTLRMLVGRSPTEFREQQQRELLAQKMRDLVRAPVRVSEPEALGMYIDEKSTASLNYFPVKQSYVGRYLTPHDGEIAEWAKDPANATLVDNLVTSRK